MRKRATRDRRSFTLIEMIVVIAIITALMAITASAVIKYLGIRQEENTKSTLAKVQSALNKAWSKVKDQAYKEVIPPTVLSYIQTNLAGNDANAAGRTRVIYVKLKLRQYFPMNFNEALNTTTPPSPLPPLQAYVQALNNAGATPTGAAYESSACLLMALQSGVSGAGIDPSNFTAGGATGSAGSLMYLTDAWGQPIYFSRFPTGSTVLNPNGPQPGANDPGDPLGYLQLSSWGTSSSGSLFSSLTLQSLATGNNSYKLAPMVASSGMDRIPQFNTITFAPTPGSDDLFSNP